jgi:hypothetical protein
MLVSQCVRNTGDAQLALSQSGKRSETRSLHRGERLLTSRRVITIELNAIAPADKVMRHHSVSMCFPCRCALRHDLVTARGRRKWRPAAQAGQAGVEGPPTGVDRPLAEGMSGAVFCTITLACPPRSLTRRSSLIGERRSVSNKRHRRVIEGRLVTFLVAALRGGPPASMHSRRRT